MDRHGNMFNLFMDADGLPQRVRIGNIDDLVTLDGVKEVTPIARLNAQETPRKYLWHSGFRVQANLRNAAMMTT